MDIESLWYDELLELDITQHSLNTILPLLPRHTALPLDYILLHFWVLFGRQDFWVRLPAVFYGMLALPVAYQLGRTWFGQRGGQLLMALMALSPLHLYYSREARPYSLLLLGVLIACYAVWHLRRQIRWRYLVMLQVGTLIFALSHFFANAIYMPLFGLLAADLIFSKNRKHVMRVMGAVLITGGIAFATILALGWGGPMLKTSRGFAETILEPERFTLDAEEKPNQGAGPEISWNYFRFKVLKPMVIRHSDIAMWVINGLAFVGFVFLLYQKRYHLAWFLSIWLIVPSLVILAFLLHQGTFFSIRYILSTLPAYLALVAAGVLGVAVWANRLGGRQIATVVSAVLVGFIVFNFVYGVTLIYDNKVKEDWRLVGDFLRKNAHPDDTVIVINGEETLNWYYPPADAEPDTYDKLETVQEALDQTDRSWVVYSIFSPYLPEGRQIKVWLSEQGAIRLVLHHDIAVYYYGRNADPLQLLAEIREFALPVDHRLYASLARENRQNPAVARQYYLLAIENAPDDEVRADYEVALEALQP
ncbi:MAG: glycosyltransferase family 39 protein [Anaerolineae bacterium]|nr:glycosyltransferase family 39 protein [Anaerolineae bacterium]